MSGCSGRSPKTSCRSWTDAASTSSQPNSAILSSATGTVRWRWWYATRKSWHNTVAEVVSAGFVERDTGRIRRPVQALFHQYSPDREDAGPSADVTHSQ